MTPAEIQDLIDVKKAQLFILETIERHEECLKELFDIVKDIVKTLDGE